MRHSAKLPLCETEHDRVLGWLCQGHSVAAPAAKGIKILLVQGQLEAAVGERSSVTAVTPLWAQAQPRSSGYSSVPKGWTTFSALMAVAEPNCYNRILRFALLWWLLQQRLFKCCGSYLFIKKKLRNLLPASKALMLQTTLTSW